MGTITRTAVKIDEPQIVYEAAHSISLGKLITASKTRSGTLLQVHETTTNGGDGSSFSWEVQSKVLSLDWASPNFGELVAISLDTGTIEVWGRKPALFGKEKVIELGAYTLLSSILCNCNSRQIHFAPYQNGLILGALSEDGQILIYEADQILCPSRWTLHTKIKVADEGQAKASCFCWRPAADLLLAVGCGSKPVLWQYVKGVMAWQQVGLCALEDSERRGAAPPRGTAAVVAIHWSGAMMGKEAEQLAVSFGREVAIFAVKGETGALAVELLEVLQHDAAAWKIEWDLFGSQLAISTEEPSAAVHLYRQGLTGAYKLISRIVGDPSADRLRA